jgi:molybdenum cofactor cytidylyltransferase
VIAGLILAAGAGSRFGAHSKLLAELEGRPLLEHAVRAACGVAELERVVVVLGFCADDVLDRMRFGRAEPVICTDWSDGLSASLRCGLDALGGASKVIVTLGDQPLITSAAIARFLEEPGGARAAYRGAPGHPVVLERAQMEAVSRLGGDVGARAILRGGPLIECSGLCSGADVDTPGDLETIRAQGSRRRI